MPEVGKETFRLVRAESSDILEMDPVIVSLNIIIIIRSFYIALFSTLEQTHCAH